MTAREREAWLEEQRRERLTAAEREAEDRAREHVAREASS